MKFNRKSLTYTIDALIGISLLVLAVFLLYKYYSYKTEIPISPQDIANTIVNTKVSDLELAQRSTTVNNLITQKTLSRDSTIGDLLISLYNIDKENGKEDLFKSCTAYGSQGYDGGDFKEYERCIRKTKTGDFLLNYTSKITQEYKNVNFAFLLEDEENKKSLFNFSTTSVDLGELINEAREASSSVAVVMQLINKSTIRGPYLLKVVVWR